MIVLLDARGTLVATVTEQAEHKKINRELSSVVFKVLDVLGSMPPDLKIEMLKNAELLVKAKEGEIRKVTRIGNAARIALNKKILELFNLPQIGYYEAILVGKNVALFKPLRSGSGARIRTNSSGTPILTIPSKIYIALGKPRKALIQYSEKGVIIRAIHDK